jgi:hypothetical protein
MFHAALKMPVVACTHINNHAFGFVKGHCAKKNSQGQKKLDTGVEAFMACPNGLGACSMRH